MSLNTIFLSTFLFFSTFIYSQEKTITIPEKTFTSSFLVEASSPDDILLDISIYNKEGTTLIKKIKLEIVPNNKYYKIDLSELPKNSDFIIVIKEKENELLNELISNK